MFPTPQGSGQSLIGDLDTELGRAPLRSLVAPHRSAPSVFSVAPSSRPIGPPHRSARWLPRRAPSVRPSVSSVAPSSRPIGPPHRSPRWLPRRAPSVRSIGPLGGPLVAPNRSAPSVPSVAPSSRPIDPLPRRAAPGSARAGGLPPAFLSVASVRNSSRSDGWVGVAAGLGSAVGRASRHLASFSSPRCSSGGAAASECVVMSSLFSAEGGAGRCGSIASASSAAAAGLRRALRVIWGGVAWGSGRCWSFADGLRERGEARIGGLPAWVLFPLRSPLF
jgi:hypothetical protein